MKHVLIIVGSMRKNSFNRTLAEKAAEMLNGRAEVSFLEYADVPFLNQDAEFPTPVAVARVREQILAADGIWIFTPEYNGSYPGVLKNMLDWMSRPMVQGDPEKITAIQGKKVTISGAGGGAATLGSRTKLRELLTFIRAKVMEGSEVGISVGGEAFRTGMVTLTTEHLAQIWKQSEAFLKFIEE